MARVDLFKFDWNDMDKVIDLAISFGPGHTVFKHPNRENYNITHTCRTDRYRPEWVVYQTRG